MAVYDHSKVSIFYYLLWERAKNIQITWTANLKVIEKARNIPKSITSFARDLIEFNDTGEFENVPRACEQNFQALLQPFQAGERIKKDKEVEEDEEDELNDFNQVHSDDEFTEENKACKNNLKRKLGDDELPGYDGLVFLFNDSNEDKIIEKIDENTLEEDRKLPLDPAYWGVLDLARESLYGYKEITENDLQIISNGNAN
ncbi:15465_t:CDS:2 [Acaulospora morrowiae]|uniref:15465_t:CDS:1 n=1 Tax=Acaulospora morrowiae TaxID=94023 RepID=A0A9N9GQ21_9GLOM|nr:15465_t:CDS:2 [Acaulospora morrowiae]